MPKTIKRLLRWSEKYTKTDMVYLAHGGTWLFITQITASVTAFLITLLLANLLSQEVYGQYRFILTVVPILSVFTLQGVASAFIRATARGEVIDIKKVTSTRIKWGLIGSVIGLVCSLYYFSKGNELLAYAMLITAIFIPIYDTYLVYAYHLKGKEDFKLSSIYESLSRIIQMVITVATVIITKNILAIVLAFFLGKYVTNLYFYKKTDKIKKFSTQPELGTTDEQTYTKDVLTYGKKLSVIGVIGIIAVNADKIFVWHLLGDSELAIYHIALTIPMTIVLFANIIPRIALPKLSRSSWDGAFKRQLMRKLLIVFGILFIVASLYALIIPPLLPILFTSYTSSVTTALIFALLIPFSSINSILAQVFRATKAVWDIVIMRSLFLFSLFVLFVNTHETLGINGAAIALVISEILMTIAGFILLTKIKEQEPTSKQ